MMSLAILVAPVIPPGQTFACTPTAVYDGDGPICAPRDRVSVLLVSRRARWTGRAEPISLAQK